MPACDLAQLGANANSAAAATARERQLAWFEETGMGQNVFPGGPSTACEP